MGRSAGQLHGCLPLFSQVHHHTCRLPAEEPGAATRVAAAVWLQGTADAVRQYLWLFEDAMRDGVEDFLILSGLGSDWAVTACLVVAWLRLHS